MAGPTTPASLLHQWLMRQLPPPAAGWLTQTLDELARSASGQTLQRAVAGAPRKVGKQALTLSAADLAAAETACAGWRPDCWTTDQAARVLLLLGVETSTARLADRLHGLSATADIGELVTFYRGLPLYPEPSSYLAWAVEGLRTSMRVVFEAVAHDNPYPAAQFAEAAWNQMVLKSLFIESALHPIEGLDERSNPALARMLCDYAHERWAAGRPVSYELWRCVGRHADAAACQDLARVLKTGSPRERQAAALALSEAPVPCAGPLLAAAPELVDMIANRRLDWNMLQAVAA
jgi:hypothetical protein